MTKVFLTISFLLLMLPSLAQADTRIIGGTAASAKSWPWIAALTEREVKRVDQGRFCAGVIIRTRWALSAAHCVRALSSRRIILAYGQRNLRSPNQKRVSVEKKYVHPLFKKNGLYIDLVLLKLNKDVRFPGISLSKQLPANGSFQTAGWGRGYLLEKIKIDSIDPILCREYYGGILKQESMFCAGQAGKDTCTGDSGGPIITKNPTILQGIISFGRVPCGKYPGVYTRIDTARSWISKIIKK